MVTRTRLINHALQCLLILAAFSGNEALGAEARLPGDKPAAPCALLERFDGNVQILDAARNDLVYTNLNTAVPCGGWVTVRQGWAQLRHKDGHVYRLSPETFLEVFDPTGNPAGKSDAQLVLYRGRVWLDVPGGTPVAQVLTANSRATLKRGTALIVYSQENEETQLLGLREEASLANRYEKSREIVVRPGELTALNLKLMRVVPTAPAPMEIASVKEVLSGLPIDASQMEKAIAVSQKRLDRKFATQPKGDRKIASTKTDGPAKDLNRYRRYPAEAHGEKSNGKVNSPKVSKGKRQVAQASSDEIELEMDRKRFKEEEAEKKQVLEDLSRLHAE